MSAEQSSDCSCSRVSKIDFTAVDARRIHMRDTRASDIETASLRSKMMLEYSAIAAQGGYG